MAAIKTINQMAIKIYNEITLIKETRDNLNELSKDSNVTFDFRNTASDEYERLGTKLFTLQELYIEIDPEVKND